MKPDICQLISVTTFVSEAELEITVSYRKWKNTFGRKDIKDSNREVFMTRVVIIPFFQENMKKFKWESGRIVINYAVANLFLSMDKTEDYPDIRNMEEMQWLI